MKPQVGPLPVLERYELKYTVPRDMIPAISAFVEPYCALDYHSSISSDGFYQVNSLYFDSPEFVLLRNRLGGVHDRFNMRVRTYGADPKPPWFLEVKRKVGDIIRKYRGRVLPGDLAHILDIGTDLKTVLASPGDASNAALFRRLAHAYGTAPVVMTSYQRKAYFSQCDDYARVTFDVGMVYSARDRYDPLPDAEGFAPTDLETIYDEGTDVVLELKCYAKNVPLWMVDLVRRFELRRRGFSKFSAGMAQVFRKYEFDTGERVPTMGPSRSHGDDWDDVGG